jgi:hypothetical protein
MSRWYWPGRMFQKLLMIARPGFASPIQGATAMQRVRWLLCVDSLLGLKAAMRRSAMQKLAI